MNSTEPAMLLLDDETVARYLRMHPDFFQRYPALVSELSLPHESGSAVSLVERQVSLLRERNIDLRKRFAQLMRTAEDNDARFNKTRKLTLAWLDAESLAQLDDALRGALVSEFGADFAICYYQDDDDAGVHPSGTQLRRLPAGQEPPLAQLTQATGVSCGMLRGDEMSALFDVDAGDDGSAALVQLDYQGLTGLLGIGSRDPNRFTPDMGTLFVCYIGDVLARALLRLVRQHSRAQP